jgi:hypothetical protein
MLGKMMLPKGIGFALEPRGGAEHKISLDGERRSGGSAEDFKTGHRRGRPSKPHEYFRIQTQSAHLAFHCL